MLDGHGDDLYSVDGKVNANFSSNVYYKGCPPLLMNALIDGMDRVNNYPSPVALELAELAGDYYNMSNNCFLFTNGATEAFYLIAHCFKGRKAAIVVPTFAEYEDACRLYNLEVELIQPKETETTSADIIFICNPNNPDGKAWDVQELRRLIAQKKETHFVIDEAYIEFTKGTTSLISKVNACENLTVVRSLTKTFAIPGARLGYLVANESFIQTLKMHKMPWSVNALAIEAGKYIFKNYQRLSFDIDELLHEKELFWNLINRLENFECVKSDTSYFLVEVKKGTAKALKQQLLLQHQILVRDATNFNGLEGQFIRLAVQEKEKNKQLIKALEEWGK